MADAIQPATRNLYQKKFAFLEYRDGAGHSYAEQIRLQSWPNNEDVPPQAQPSARETIESGGAASRLSTPRPACPTAGACRS